MMDITLRPPIRHQIRAAKLSSQITLEPPEQISCYVNLQEKKKTLPLSGTLHRSMHF
jgi:hypothetical protein